MLCATWPRHGWSLVSSKFYIALVSSKLYLAPVSSKCAGGPYVWHKQGGDQVQCDARVRPGAVCRLVSAHCDALCPLSPPQSPLWRFLQCLGDTQSWKGVISIEYGYVMNLSAAIWRVVKVWCKEMYSGARSQCSGGDRVGLLSRLLWLASLISNRRHFITKCTTSCAKKCSTAKQVKIATSAWGRGCWARCENTSQVCKITLKTSFKWLHVRTFKNELRYYYFRFKRTSDNDNTIERVSILLYFWGAPSLCGQYFSWRAAQECSHPNGSWREPSIIIADIGGGHLTRNNGKMPRISQCPEKAPTWVFSLMKAPSSAFTIKNLIRQISKDP